MQSPVSVLVVDDELEFRDYCVTRLRQGGFLVSEAASVEQAIRALEEQQVDIVLTDLNMPGLNGLQLVKLIREYYRGIDVVMMTGYASVSTAVEAMKLGAADYLTKPFDADDLCLRLTRLASHRAVVLEGQALREQLNGLRGEGSLIGASPLMQEIFQFILRAAPRRIPVLIQGESGTGKELVARAMHEHSPWRPRPFVVVDCGALPENLIERELFGHVRGAFTDAHSDRRGLLAAAEDGTLFFDEIGELPLSVQSTLLRALQEREFRPLGSTHCLPLHARVVAATNRDLKAALDREFRSDLYYRLKVLEITLPPLRQRRGDIPALAGHFLSRHCEVNRDVVGLSRAALEALSAYAWPGNVRELENCIQRAMVAATGPLIEPRHLPEELRPTQPAETGGPAPAGLTHIELIERQAIVDMLATARGNRVAAARLLGVSKSFIYKKLKEYGIHEEETGTAGRGAGR